ncbi:MAG: nucleotide disphospho-sugar-binding domain-containing protein [Umezawaea sp.]
MRVLLTNWAWPTHMHHLISLGWAFAANGHEVRVASQPALSDVIGTAGLTGVVLGKDVDLLSPEVRERAGMPVSQLPEPGSPPDYLRMWQTTTTRMEVLAEAMTSELVSFAKDWKPDLIIWDWMTFAGPITGRLLGIPTARLLYGPDMFVRLADAATAVEPDAVPKWLDSLYGRFGASVDTAARGWGETWCVDTSPASIQMPGIDGVPMRYVPYNGVSVAPAWTASPPSRRRVCVTMGTSSKRLRGRDSVSLPVLLEGLADLDAEIVVAGTTAQALDVSEAELPGNATFVEYLPLHALLPTCSAILHQGGIGSAMTSAHAGVPQVIAAAIADQPFNAERFGSVGAAIPVAATVGCELDVIDAVHRVLEEPKYSVAAASVRDEILSRPTPSAVAEWLAAESS